MMLLVLTLYTRSPLSCAAKTWLLEYNRFFLGVGLTCRLSNKVFECLVTDWGSYLVELLSLGNLESKESITLA